MDRSILEVARASSIVWQGSVYSFFAWRDLWVRRVRNAIIGENEIPSIPITPAAYALYVRTFVQPMLVLKWIRVFSGGRFQIQKPCLTSVRMCFVPFILATVPPIKYFAETHAHR